MVTAAGRSGPQSCPTVGLIGTIAWGWMPALLAGSLIGGYVGSHYAIKKGNRWIKRVFEIVTILIGLKLVFS